MVADIATTGVNRLGPLHFPPAPVSMGGVLYFFAEDGVHGRELWRSDGTGPGTWRLSDICPGECLAGLDPVIVAHQGTLYFSAEDGVHGRELWKSDGTAEGTRMVKDIAPGSASASPGWMIPLGSNLLFTASDGTRGRELWKTDGTTAGTVLVTDIHPSGSSNPASFTVWDGAAYFTADDGAHGDELWRTDGSATGTWMVRDISPGTNGSLGRDQTQLTNLFTPVPLGEHLLFSASDGLHGRELWRTDGTGSGTELLLDLEPGVDDSSPTQLTRMGGAVYFRARQQATGAELWVSDGSTAGTRLLRDLEPGTGSSSPRALTVAAETLFFAAGTTDAGTELWASDGTTAGTAMVEDILPGPTGGLDRTFLFGLDAFGDRLLFTARDGVHGREPWVSDGSPGGTLLLADLEAGAAGSFDPVYRPLISTVQNGRAYFFGQSDTVGYELFATDGTPTGTELVTDIDRQMSSIPMSILFRWTEMADLGGTLFLRADDGVHGPEIWKTDGTEAGTELVGDLFSSDSPGFPIRLTPLGDQLLFVNERPTSDSTLWSSDGTEAGTSPVVPDGSSFRPHEPSRLTPFGGAVFFNADDDQGNGALWRSDGSEGGTAPYLSNGVRDLEPLGDRLYLGRRNGLWWTDGRPGGTESRIAEVDASQLRAAESLLFFRGVDDAAGAELWVSDGTAEETRRVLDVRPGPEGSVPRSGSEEVFLLKKPPLENGHQIAALPNRNEAFFVADDGVHGAELWWSDGTAAGTYLLRDVYPGKRSSEPRYLTVVREVAYFVADDGVHGAELWRSDGTPEGTFLFGDLEPGAGSSIPASLTEIFSHLVFSAWRSRDGRELWVSDGTAERTLRLQDIHPGEGSSSPDRFTLSGGRLFFTANDGEHGFEPWALPATPPLVVATMTVSGVPVPGGTVVYNLVLTNLGTFGQLDNPGPEMIDTLPPGLTVLGATADTGTVTVTSRAADQPAARASATATDVSWNGSIPGQESVTITIEGRIDPDLDIGTTLTNQASVRFDGDGDGNNESSAPSDDPGTDTVDDATVLVVRAANALAIPAASESALLFLGLLLAAAGLGVLRR